MIRAELGGLPFIAEDLGLITADVEALRDHFQIPGTRVLQFAFDGHEDNPHLPQNVSNNAVVYTGTHDNPTSREWFEELTDAQRQALSKRYFSNVANGDTEPGPALMTLGWQCRGALAIAPLQDLLNLGRDARMNVPGHAAGNWRWRCTEAMLADEPFACLRDLTARSERLACAQTGAN
jgi:4-alpha-glucanotransferase